MPDQTVAVMERFNAALKRHDIEGMLAEMAEDTVFENTSPAPDGTRLEGIDAMRKFFTELFEANPGTRFDIEEQFVAGDRCLVRWRSAMRNLLARSASLSDRCNHPAWRPAERQSQRGSRGNGHRSQAATRRRGPPLHFPSSWPTYRQSCHAGCAVLGRRTTGNSVT